MDDFDRELLASHPAWQQVLQMYLSLTAEPQEQPQEQTGPRWAPRINSLEDLEPEELSVIHGQLIAMGWLKFQFETEQTGLMYRTSSEGRMLLSRVRGEHPVCIQEEIVDSELEQAREDEQQQAAA